MEYLSFIGVAWDLLKSIFVYFKPPDPREKLNHRIYIKDKIDKYLYEFNTNRLSCEDYYSDAIIRNIKKIDSYPEIFPNKKGISAWFQVSIVGLYYRGVKVLLRWTYITISEQQGWIFSTNDDENAIIVALIGYIPYENIVDVDITGDEHYQLPHIYCNFAQNGEPYEELIFCEEIEGYMNKYFMEISDYKSVKRLSTKLNIHESY